MLELVKERAEALFSKLNNSVTVKRKQILWENIATRVNARRKTQRPTQKVKQKWSDLRLNAIRLRSKLKKKKKKKKELQVAVLLPKSHVLNAKACFANHFEENR